MAIFNKNEIKKLKESFARMNSVDIAAKFNDFSAPEMAIAVTLIDKETMAEVFAEFGPEKKEEIILNFTKPEITDMLEEMDSDDLVDSIQELPSNMVTKILSHVDKQRRDTINKLLNYPEESVGSLMNVEYVVIRKGNTRTEAFNKIKESDASYEHLTSIYVIDNKRELLGYIYVSDLIKIDSESLDEIINYDIIYVNTRDDQEKAAKLFNKYHFLALPVIDSESRLVGIITADDIFEIIAEEIYEDYILMEGIQVPKESYLDATPWALAKKRVFWLLFLMISATFTGKIIQSYDNLLSTSVILAAFIPMLMDSGGNSGSQSSTLIIRALALNEVSNKDFLKVAFKEMSVGIIVGFIVAVVNYFRIIFLSENDPLVALTVSATLFFTVVISKLIGGLLPLIAKSLKQDPALMASPLITTIVDTVSLFIYFTIASFLL